MIEFLEAVLPYIKGLWTLPWILIGFLVTLLLSRFFDEEKINMVMKKIGLILLYFFVPLLLFKIFLSVDFGQKELEFTAVCVIVFSFMYILAYFFAVYKLKKMHQPKETKNYFLKTVLTNQGRSSAFVGGAMLAISEWWIPAAIYMSVGAIFLFAFIPYILSYFYKKDMKTSDKDPVHHALPWYLRVFPWYLLCFAAAAILIHGMTDITPRNLGDFGIVFDFFTSLTIPAALYYVGTGIHPHDLKVDEMKKLFNVHKQKKSDDHWGGVRNIFFLTVILTPLLTVIVLFPLLLLQIIPKEWFSVIMINSILPITSTNMFLVPYGIDKKITAHAITWTTIVCVPIVVLLIYIFSIYL
ncbi:MAG: hypothetical protein V1726_05820 [Methanobacteriota archaeon]